VCAVFLLITLPVLQLLHPFVVSSQSINQIKHTSSGAERASEVKLGIPIFQARRHLPPTPAKAENCKMSDRNFAAHPTVLPSINNLIEMAITEIGIVD
jgi:hypothetical protein